MAGVKDFYKKLQQGVKVLAGKRIYLAQKRWNYRLATDTDVPLPESVARFLVRFGQLDGGFAPEEQVGVYNRLLGEISRGSGDSQGQIDAWLKCYSGGDPEVAGDGICGTTPSCARCALAPDCRYLAGGGRETRASSEFLVKALAAGEGGLTGSGALHQAAELLALLISGERCGQADLARAEALLKEHGGLRPLFRAQAQDLLAMGIPEGAVARLRAAAELCRLWAGEPRGHGQVFNSGQDFFDRYHTQLRDLKKEVFIVVMLDQKNRWLGDERVSEGTLTETLVHPREVFAAALEKRAAALALVHNHPSGDPAPSSADKQITRRVCDVARLHGIRVIDHVIVGDGKFASFVDLKLMPKDP